MRTAYLALTGFVTVLVFIAGGRALPDEGEPDPGVVKPYLIKGAKCEPGASKLCSNCSVMYEADPSCKATGHKCLAVNCKSAGTIAIMTCVYNSAVPNSFCDASNSSTAIGCTNCFAGDCGCSTGSSPESCALDASHCGNVIGPTGCTTDPNQPISSPEYKICP